MVDNNSRKLIGNICLHKDLVPERHFLQRNLRHILDTHELRLQRILTNDGSREDMIANEQRISGWDFPTREMLEDLMKGQKPVLQLDALQLRHPKSKARIQKRSRNQINGDDGMDWLPDPQSEYRLPCKVGINVVDTRSTKIRTYSQTVNATVVQDSSNDRFPIFSIELDKPFLIELEKLFVVAETGSNGYRWKRTLTTKYTLEVKIYCNDSEDTADFLGRLEDRPPAVYSEVLAKEGILKALWENLPECPPEGHLLGLKRAHGHKLLDLEYKLEISMGWTRKRESPLQRYNQKLAETQRADRQLPTPSASDDLDKQLRKYVISYNFREGLIVKSTTVEGLYCPFCRNGGEQPNFHHLQLHLMLHHDHFEFEADQRHSQGSSEVRMTLWMSLSEKETGADKPVVDRSPEEEKQNWIAPDRPFNIRDFVRGKDKWGRQPKARTLSGKRKGGKDRDRDYITHTEHHPVLKRPALDDVQDLPQHSPKKRKVPDVPRVRFYHTSSKQVIEPGEEVAESDDYVDDSWLMQNQTHALEELGITGAAQEFTNAFNEYLAREQSDSSVLTREALVRFARRYHEELQDIKWQRQFRAKLNLLRGVGIISDDTVSHCVRKLSGGSDVRMADADAGSAAGAEDEDESPINHKRRVNGEAETIQRRRKKWATDKVMPQNSRDSGKGKARMVNGDTDEDTHMDDAPSVNGDPSSSDSAKYTNVCVCGKSAYGVRGSIACADRVSIKRINRVELDSS